MISQLWKIPLEFNESYALRWIPIRCFFSITKKKKMREQCYSDRRSNTYVKSENEYGRLGSSTSFKIEVRVWLFSSSSNDRQETTSS